MPVRLVNLLRIHFNSRLCITHRLLPQLPFLCQNKKQTGITPSPKRAGSTSKGKYICRAVYYSIGSGGRAGTERSAARAMCDWWDGCLVELPLRFALSNTPALRVINLTVAQAELTIMRTEGLMALRWPHWDTEGRMRNRETGVAVVVRSLSFASYV